MITREVRQRAKKPAWLDLCLFKLDGLVLVQVTQSTLVVAFQLQREIRHLRSFRIAAISIAEEFGDGISVSISDSFEAEDTV